MLLTDVSSPKLVTFLFVDPSVAASMFFSLSPYLQRQPFDWDTRKCGPETRPRYVVLVMRLALLITYIATFEVFGEMWENIVSFLVAWTA